MDTSPAVVDKLVGFEEDYTDSSAGTQLLIRHSMDIPDDYISDLKRDKIDPDHAPSGDFMKVATIPVIWVEKWKREGFDIYQASAKEIIKRLRNEQLDAFITTNKRV
jgi:hypothetical protein